MTDAALPADRFVPGDFRIGRVLVRAGGVVSRNILKLGLVSAIADLPSLLLPRPAPANVDQGFDVPMFLAALSLMMLVGLLGQAIVTCGAFEDMRRRPVVLAVGLKVFSDWGRRSQAVLLNLSCVSSRSRGSLASLRGRRRAAA
jgi:hypothetical protein